MTTSVLSGLSAFGNDKLALILADSEYDSNGSEIDNMADSDYSLSDIEEGLDEDAEIDYIRPCSDVKPSTLRSNLIRPKSDPCLLESSEKSSRDPKLRRKTLYLGSYSAVRNDETFSSETERRKSCSSSATIPGRP